MRKKSKLRNFLKRTGIIPIFNEESLFVMVFCLFLVAVTNYQAIYYIRDYVLKNIEVAVVFLLYLGAAMRIIRNAFVSKRISKMEKNAILLFAVMTHGLTGILVSLFIINKGVGGIFFVLAAWNMASAVLVILLHRANILDESSIIANNPKKNHVMVHSGVAVLIFLISQYYFRNPAIITYSLCICYATSFGGIINNFLPKIS